ncbi:hypothetical protein I543_0355 [Mycobacteroides abscessus 21]|uniref:Uncharacterized protein n=1 Tax=Mycobacteroides abscessus 21 TaxID=1299324 RepID=A0A829Q9A1_9MYCO|nr:hypothetical protein I543_0355 [Mycobacteroides abscessus 21]
MRLGRLYREIRPAMHTNLSRAVGDALGVPLTADSLQAKITHSFTQRFAVHVTRIPLVIVLFKDIEIGKNATLTLSSKAKSLWANDIRIHSGVDSLSPPATSKSVPHPSAAIWHKQKE